MNKTIKNLFLLTIIYLTTPSTIQPSNQQTQEPLVLKIMNNSNQSAILNEIEYSYAFTINKKVQKHAIPNTTAIQFSAHQAKQLAINVSVPTPTATPKGASIEFNPMGITAIQVHSKKNPTNNKKIIINPPYYHLNIANTEEAPSICINYNAKDGWHIESCKKIKNTKKTTTPANKLTTTSTGKASAASVKTNTILQTKKAPAKRAKTKKSTSNQSKPKTPINAEAPQKTTTP